MEPMRVSMVCMQSLVGDVHGNAKKIEDQYHRLISEGSDLVCFPELSLTGYSTDHSPDHAMRMDDPLIGGMADLTSSIGGILCFGFVEEGLYITQLVVENGKIAGSYRKTHLGEREAKVFSPGNELNIIRTTKVTIGIQTCWESHFPQITASYALQGADLVLMPHASGLSGDRRRGAWNKILPARAYDNTLFVASCNMVGDNGYGTVFGGGACIVDERGNILAEDYSGECVVSANLDPKDMDRIREPGYVSMRDLYFLDELCPDLYVCRKQ